MSQKIPLLVGILILQSLLVGLFNFGSTDSEAPQQFLSVETDQVVALEISDAQGEGIALSRTADGWQLAGGLPADGDKVDGLIEALSGGAATWPVATSVSSQSRFEVTEESHQRRIVMRSADGVLADVLLGNSPGFRRVHARTASADAVYSIDFAIHEAPTDADEWLDKYLLQTKSISAVTLVDGTRLARAPAAEADADAERWVLDGQPAASEAVRSFLQRIERLSVLGLSSVDAVAPTELGPTRAVSVEAAAGNYRMSFQLDEANDEYILTTDRYEGRFTVASYLAEQILIDAAELAPAAEEPAGEAMQPEVP